MKSGESHGTMTVSLREIGLAVKRLQWRHHREGNARLAEIGLSLPQWDVLRHAAANPEASGHELAVLTFQSDQAFGTMANRMIAKGLLVRVQGHGRAMHYRLTPAGEDARRAGAAILDEVMTGSIGQLSPTEQATLHSLLVKATGRL
ncbi:MarR family winged helix-turn-helix transcriptional regulator [Amycolatopsis pigmentata]|uniref:MarR family winged helix-turn-helix transcriptional regulator n=1 Tax=Amycolatopsis pigmentata TaxID=450801 RepID=A0ABW5G5T3_9PSEU